MDLLHLNDLKAKLAVAVVCWLTPDPEVQTEFMESAIFLTDV